MISGAGISVNAGGTCICISDADRADMTLQSPTSKLCVTRANSREDFNTSVHNTGDSTDRPYYMIDELSSGMLEAAPTGFHHFLDQLAVSGRLLRHYTQNVDYNDRTLPSISPV